MTTLPLNRKVVGLGLLFSMMPFAICPADPIVAALATGLVLDQLSKQAQQIIDQATASGDYLLGRAGIQAAIAIENARLASIDVLDVTFSKIDEERFKAISDIGNVIDKTQSGAMGAAEALQKVQEGGQQITIILDGQGQRSYITRYSPSVVYKKLNSQKIMISVRGVNLDDSQAVLEINNSKLKPISSLKQELTFEFSDTNINYPSEKPSLLKGVLTYKTVKAGWVNRLIGSKESVQREIPIMVLPTVVAKLVYTPTVSHVVLDRQLQDYDLEQFRGYESDMERNIAPPPGYKIDLATLSSYPVRDGGGGSYCIGFSDSGKTEQGVTYRAHVGRIRDPMSKPGYVNCHVKYYIYKEHQGTAVAPKTEAELHWNSDFKFDLAAGQKSFELIAKTFDGRERNISGPSTDKYFVVTQEPTRILISPKIPTDLGSH